MNDEHSKEEADRRRDEIIKRMLATPPQPRKLSKTKATPGKPSVAPVSGPKKG
jgi:hypothetical protein